MRTADQITTGQMDYGKTASQLAQDLAMIKEFSEQLTLRSSLELIEQIAIRLREHRFTVAVVGEFKTGKSTFVNALLGVDVVPTDVVPATATLNRITYGLESSIEVVYKDKRREPVAFDKLKEFVTKEYVTTDLLETIDEVVINYPAPYLLNNVDLIDTPGLNDESSMTSVTLSVLPRIDAAVLVISGLSPFSEYTRQFLEERLLSADLGRVIFLVSRIGQLGSAESADRIISHVEKRIAQNVLDRAKRELGEDSTAFEIYVKKIGKPRVFGIDAYDALEAILKNDPALLEKSRFPTFQNGLRRFLNEDRGAIVLQVPVNRILASANEIQLSLNLRREAARMTLQEFNSKRDIALEELDRVRQRKRDDVLEVERKKAEATESALALLKGLDGRVKAGVRDAILGAELTDGDVKKGHLATDKIQSIVNFELRRLTESEGDRVAADVTRHLAAASDNLQSLNADLEQTVKTISFNFGATRRSGEQVGVAAMAGAAGLFIGGFGGVVGGVVSGYRQAGLVGAAAGGTASFTATYATLATLSFLFGPFTIPMVIGACLVGYFAGDRMTKLIFKGSRAKGFKERAVQQTLKQIEDMKLERDLMRATKTYVQETFDNLIRTVSNDVDAVIDNTQRTLDQLARDKERQDVLTQEQVRELDQMAARTKMIQERTMLVNQLLTARASEAAL